MKVKELIEQLQKQDLEKEVIIRQGKGDIYMIANHVKDLVVTDKSDVDESVNAVIIEYIQE